MKTSTLFRAYERTVDSYRHVEEAARRTRWPTIQRTEEKLRRQLRKLEAAIRKRLEEQETELRAVVRYHKAKMSLVHGWKRAFSMREYDDMSEAEAALDEFPEVRAMLEEQS